jgi:hypothetical protein
MDNASVILRTFDAQLNHSVRLVLYGRAAVQLGFKNAPENVAQSKDVDAIIPLSDLELLTADSQFWDAQEATNEKLSPQGLYITHLFRSDQVFLRRDWENFLQPIQGLELRWLKLHRPATVDLILTKMMRGDDAQDMEDIAFMVRHDLISPQQIEEAFRDAIIPNVLELREAFEKAKPRVRQIVSGH